MCAAEWCLSFLYGPKNEQDGIFVQFCSSCQPFLTVSSYFWCDCRKFLASPTGSKEGAPRTFMGFAFIPQKLFSRNIYPFFQIHRDYARRRLCFAAMAIITVYTVSNFRLDIMPLWCKKI